MAYSGRYNDPIFPQMVICGNAANNMPQLLFGPDQTPPQYPERNCPAPCNQDRNQSNQQRYNSNIQQQQQQPAMCLPRAPNRMEMELQQKIEAIDNMQRILCCLQCEMDEITQQNEKLNSKIQKAYMKQMQGRGNTYSCLEEKLQESFENMKMMEKQVVEMENAIKTLKNELKTVKEERSKQDQKQNIFLVHPPGWCGSLLPMCAGWKPPSCS